MDTRDSTEDGAVRKVEFRYQPGSSRYELRELGLFRLRLLAALRVAHGLGGGLELSWETGTTGGIALTPQDPRSTRWVRQVLAPAYTGGRWVEHRRAPGRKFDHHRRIAVMRPGALAPLGLSADNPPGCDTALLARGLLTPGVRIHWEAQPIFHSPTYSSPPPANTLVQVPPGWRTKPVTRPEQALLDQTTEHAWSSHWMVRGTVGASEPTVGPSMVEDAARPMHVLQVVSRARRHLAQAR
ncbi:MAG: hypothetical protein L3J96_03230, partial [Thermoplasmata archaeon]|nr:hypothetical protein [Thermoplasmata archaeon]